MTLKKASATSSSPVELEERKGKDGQSGQESATMKTKAEGSKRGRGREGGNSQSFMNTEKILKETEKTTEIINEIKKKKTGI